MERPEGLAKVTEEKENARFYNVDRFKESIQSRSNSRPSTRLQSVYRSVSGTLDSFEGVFQALVGVPVMFGSILVVATGALYGPVAFLVAVGGTLGLLGFYVNRKVGRSLSFTVYSLSDIVKSVTGQLVAFGTFLIILYFVLNFLRY